MKAFPKVEVGEKLAIISNSIITPTKIQILSFIPRRIVLKASTGLYALLMAGFYFCLPSFLKTLKKAFAVCS